MLLLSCAPRAWQGSPWQGDDTFATGVVCQGDTLHADVEYWVRVGVRYHEDVEVDWQGATLDLVNAEVVKRDLGPARLAGPHLWMRYDTFFVKPLDLPETPISTGPEGPVQEPLERRVASLGPYHVSFRGSGGEDWIPWEAGGCTPRIP